MGAASSMNVQSDIYISYPEKTEFIDRIEKELMNLNFTIIDKKKFSEIKKHNNNDISNIIEELIKKTKYIFVFISPKTLNCVIQMLEMNEILNNYDDLEYKLIYFIIDPSYNPTELKSIIRKSKSFPLYDENTLFETTSKVLSLLMMNNNSLED
jgi:hypothetical protein